MSSTSYPNAHAVYELLNIIDQSVEVQSATASHFILADEQKKPALSSQAFEYITILQQDQFIFQSDLNQEIQSYCSDYQQLDHWIQQLKSLQARQKTLQLQLRNLEKEQSKTGLFKGKAKQELMLKIQRVQQSYAQSQIDLTYLENNIENLEDTRSRIARKIAKSPQLKVARWLSHEQHVIGLTESGQFLLEYLKEINPDVMIDKPLSYVLLYGHQWSRQYT